MALFKRKEIDLVYYPNNIGNLKPSHEYDYEYVIIGKNSAGAPFKVINTFLQHRVEILGIQSSLNAERNQFSLTLLCDLENSDLPPKELLNAVRSLKFVTALESYEMKGKLFGRMFPLTFYDKQRAVAISATTMIKLAMRLAKEAGATATTVMYEEGREYAKQALTELQEVLKGSDSGEEEVEFSPANRRGGISNSSSSILQAYCVKCKSQREIEDAKQVILKNNRPAMQGHCSVCNTKVFKIGASAPMQVLSSPLIENMQGFLSAAGWGLFELRSEILGKSGEVTILDPPTFEGEILYGNQFVEGIAAGFLEKIVGTHNQMKLVGEKYYSKRRMLVLHYAQEVTIIQAPQTPKLAKEKKHHAPRRIKPKEELAQIELVEASPSPTSKAAVANEVERIIQSLEEIEETSNGPPTELPVNETEAQEVVIQGN